VTQYLTVPIDVDQQDVLQLAYNYIQTYFPNWAPAEGNLDVAILEAISTDAASLRELASNVPDTIFRWYGATILQIPPIDATPATSTVTFTAVNNAGYTIPAGTQVTIPATGDSIILFETLVDAVINPGSTTVTGVTIQAVDSGADGTDLGVAAQVISLVDALTFVTSVTLEATTSGGQDAEDDETYLDRLVGEMQLLSPRLIIPSDFAQDARNQAAVTRALALDGYNAQHNLLTAADASLEASIGNWISQTNCAVVQDATFGVDGTHSLKLTSAAAGNMTATQSAAGQVPVVPFNTYTALVTAHPAAARFCGVGIQWYTSGGALISTVYQTLSCAAGGNTPISFSAVAPATAAFARLAVEVISTAAAGEVANFDKMSLRHGTTTDWVPGGTGETNQPRTVAVFAVDAAGNAVDAGTKAAIAASAQAKREVNFIVNVMDPAYTQIDVSFDVASLPGYDTTALAAAVDDAVTTWLQPYQWGQDPTIRDASAANSWVASGTLRYNDLVAVVRGVEGVAYIKALTVGVHGQTLAAADVVLASPGSLTAPFTISGTAETS
jgi:Baseplate J-like protein